MKERKAYVILACLMFVFSVANVMYSSYTRHLNNHKFCDVVNTITEVAIPKPSNPAADPSRERSYVLYTKFVVLDKSLGCLWKY